MATPNGLYQEVFQKIFAVTRPIKLRKSAVTRLALVVTGLIGAHSCVIGQIAEELADLELTKASEAAHIERRLRRTLRDQRLTPETCYEPLVREVIDWFTPLWEERQVRLIVDESSQDERVHLFRISLAYWGGAVPLVWALWPQNQAQEPGTYWTHVDAVLRRVAALLPRGLDVVVLADRAYDIPAFVDRITAWGWHWLVRCKAHGTLRLRDRQGREEAVAAVIARVLPHPDTRWKGQRAIFKAAGWRSAHLVAVWERGAKEPLVTLSDLPCRWEVHALYDERFWIEPSFRTEKSHGWQWEANRVVGIERQQVLLTAMAWATLIVLCLGRPAAQERLDQQVHRARQRVQRQRQPAQPQPARASLFTLGWHRAHRWLYSHLVAPLCWLLDQITAPSWNTRWQQSQAHLFLFYQTVRL
jgi:hypothetical protein